jgi:hypothetical protein
MSFEWKLEKGKELTFEDKVHNLACFEIVVNILRMKTKTGDSDVSEEIQALCGFALDCMFKDSHIDDDLFNSIMKLKDKTVDKFKDNILKNTGIPREVMEAPEIGEA